MISLSQTMTSWSSSHESDALCSGVVIIFSLNELSSMESSDVAKSGSDLSASEKLLDALSLILRIIPLSKDILLMLFIDMLESIKGQRSYMWHGISSIKLEYELLLVICPT